MVVNQGKRDRVASSTQLQASSNSDAVRAEQQTIERVPTPGPIKFADVVTAMFNGFNQRDIPSISDLLDDSIVYETLHNVLQGRQRVTSFYADTMASIPEQTSFICDDVCVDEAQAKVVVTWHIEVLGMELPWSRGVSIYTFGSSGKVICIRDTPELPVGFAIPALMLAAPALSLAKPLLSNSWDASSASNVLLNMLRVPASSGSGSSGSSGSRSSRSSSGSGIKASVIPGSAAQLMQQAAPAAGAKAPATIDMNSIKHTHIIRKRTHSSANGIPMRELPDPFAAVASANSNSTGAQGASAAPVASEVPAYGSSSGPGTAAAAAGPATGSTFNTDTAAASAWAGPAAAAAAAAAAATPASGLSGVWMKDLEASDSVEYEKVLDVLGLSGLQRVTARLIEGNEISHSADKFEVSYLTVVPFFRVTESMRFDRTVTMMRRDLRGGSQTARADEIPGGVRVVSEWGEPGPGMLEEVYLLEGDKMSVRSSITIGNSSASAVQVYRRMLQGREQFFKESRQRNASFDSVIARQRQQFGDK